MEILVNGEVQELGMIDPATGVSWEADLIGNADGFDGYDDDKEMPTMTQDTFDWWEQYISTETDLDARTKALRGSIDNDDQERFREEMQAAGNNDMESEQAERAQIVDDWENK